MHGIKRKDVLGLMGFESLEPKQVFYYFKQVCDIPRGSSNTQAISDYCVRFATEHNLRVIQDEKNNVIIYKKAAKGYENSPAMILQAHLDMVCEKEAEHEFDFEKEAIKLIIDGDKLFADHTTLGADNGIGVAYCLAILADDQIPHPPLEVVLTSDEEIGMVGAEFLDPSILHGRRMLNLDSDAEDTLVAGCAGGVCVEGHLPVTYVEIENKYKIHIRIYGLRGGHSGDAIDKGRCNADKLMGRLLFELSGQFCYSILSLSGGMKDNVIPREAQAVIVVEPQDAAHCSNYISDFEEKIKKELGCREPGFSIFQKKAQLEKGRMLSPNSKGLVIFLLMNMPNGVQEMSAEIEGMVETSLNLGIMRLEEDVFVIQSLIRSCVKTAKDALRDKIAYLIEFMGGTCYILQDYPAWEYKKDSQLRDICLKAYQKVFHREPIIQTIHAGLECGILADKIKDMDCISLGPELHDIHTPKESLSIQSVEKVWRFVLEILKLS